MFLNRRHVPLILSLLFSIHYGKVLVVVVNAAALGKTRHKTPESREIFIQNETGRRIDVMWINRFVNPNTFHSNSPDEMGYAYGSSTGIDSFVGHEFEVRELPSKTTKQCLFGENACRKAHFQVSVEENQCKCICICICMYCIAEAVCCWGVRSSLLLLSNFLLSSSSSPISFFSLLRLLSFFLFYMHTL